MVTVRQGSGVVGLIVLSVVVVPARVLSIAQGRGDLDDRDRRGWWPGTDRR
jgi:hypothetical protein